MDVLNNYNVILIDSSSRTYNCHSYAWNISEGGATCWIEYGGINLSKYWTNDLYSSATQGNNYGYTRVYYSGDHSALSSYGTSYYTSKWGEGPLVRHSPTTVPASYTTNRTYYYAPAIIGPTYITLGMLPGSKNTVKMGIGVQQNREQEYSKNGNKNTVISINIINQGLHCIINKKQDCDGLKNKITYHYVSRDSQAS